MKAKKIFMAMLILALVMSLASSVALAADEPTFKAIFLNSSGTNSSGTLTFYYDSATYPGDLYNLSDAAATAGKAEDWPYYKDRSKIASVVIDSSVKNYTGLKSTAYMFSDMVNAESIEGAENLKTEEVTNMSYMFYNYGYSSKLLFDVPEVSGWDTSRVMNMSHMFDGYGSSSTFLNFKLDLSGWDIASVSSCSDVFSNVGVNTKRPWLVTIPAKTIISDSEILQNDSKNWRCKGGSITPTESKEFEVAPDTFKAVLYNSNALIFYYDNKDHEDDDPAIGVYDKLPTNAAEAKDWPYNGRRTQVTSVVIDKSVKYYTGLESTAYMFCNMTKAQSIEGEENLKTEKVTNMSSMFSNYGYNSTNLTAVPEVSGWDTSNVEDMSYMFYEYGYKSTNLNAVPTVNGEKWNTAKVTDMSYMFSNYGYNSTNLTAVPDVSKWDTSQVTNMSSMFSSYGENAKSLNVVPDVSGEKWNTGKVKNMNGMFEYYGYNSTKLTDVPDVSKWDTSQVTDMGFMFSNYGYKTTKLTVVPDGSKWDTSQVTDMKSMFSNYGRASKSLNAVPDVSKWDTSQVTNMSSIFSNYGRESTELTVVPDVSKWDTSQVTNMSSMFSNYNYGYTDGTTKLTVVPDVSNWDTSQVTNMSSMFSNYGYKATELTVVPEVSGWDTSQVTNMSSMFSNYGYSSESLDVTLDLSGWNTANVSKCSNVFNKTDGNKTHIEVTIPAKTGNLTNETGKWYCQSENIYITPPDDEGFIVGSSETSNYIKLNANGGTDGDTETSIEPGSTQTKTFTPPTRIGYTLAGWVNAKGIKVLEPNGTCVLNIDGYTNEAGEWIKAGNTVLYAQWSANSYTITLDAGSGTDGDTETSIKSGSTQTETFIPPTQDGFALTGWLTETKGTKVLDANGNCVAGSVEGYIKEGKWIKADDTELHAQWSKNISAAVQISGKEGKNFGTLEDALIFARNYAGKYETEKPTVTVKSDISQEADLDATIAPNVTLDLNGNTVEVNTILVSQDSKLMDSNTNGKGKLKLSEAGNLIYNDDKVKISSEYSKVNVLPVWDGDGYRFCQVEGFGTEWATDKPQYRFTLYSKDLERIFAENSGVEMYVHLDYKKDGESDSAEYKIDSDPVQQHVDAGSGKGCIYVTFTGEGISDMSAYACFKTNLSITSETKSYTPAEPTE